MSASTRPNPIAWDELHTKDREKAEAFYNTLFGWTVTPVEMSPEYTYHLLNRADTGEMFAGSHQQGPDEADQPSFWLVSLATDDVDKATLKSSELGATVIMEPADIPGTGRFAVLTDPQGAAYCILSYAEGGAPPDRGSGPGCIIWHELVTSDAAASANFYSSIFGYEAKEEDWEGLKGTLFKQDGKELANILPKPSPEAPDAWVFYVEVSDAQATADLAVASGGSVIAPPFALPPLGVLGWLADPTGAVFGVMQPQGSYLS